MTDDSLGNVRTMREGDLASVADIHLACFPGDLITRLGPDCVLAQYRWLFANYEGDSFVCDHEGKVVGFVTTSDRAYRRKMWRDISPQVFSALIGKPVLALSLLASLIGRLISFKRFLRPSTKSALVSDATSSDVCLATIAVDPAHRRRGIANTLVDTVADLARQRGARFIMSHTDEPNMMTVFERCGWQVYLEKKRSGVPYREYRRYFGN